MKFTGIVDSVPSRGGGGGLKIDPQMVEKTISELLAQSQDKMISIALEAGDHAASICGSFKRAEKRLDLKDPSRVAPHMSQLHCWWGGALPAPSILIRPLRV